MILLRPTVAEERWLALADRYAALREPLRHSPESGGWQRATLLTRCLSFVLGTFAASLVWGITRLLGLPLRGLLTGIILIAASEWLIARRRPFAAGLEEALWMAGALCIAFELADDPGLLAGGRIFFLFAAALALAGWRLLNPLLTTAAAVVLSVGFVWLLGRPRGFEGLGIGSQFCFAIGFLALAFGALRYARPAHDRMLDWLVVTMPIAGFAWSQFGQGGPLRWLTFALLATFGTAALVTGLRRRTHAPLIAALGCLALLVVELRHVLGLPLQWRLILWGTLGLVAAIAIERLLRVPRNGITSRDVEDRRTALELLQIGGAAVATPPPGTAPSPGFEGGDGSFGGGGASGRF